MSEFLTKLDNHLALLGKSNFKFVNVSLDHDLEKLYYCQLFQLENFLFQLFRSNNWEFCEFLLKSRLVKATEEGNVFCGLGLQIKKKGVFPMNGKRVSLVTGDLFYNTDMKEDPAIYNFLSEVIRLSDNLCFNFFRQQIECGAFPVLSLFLFTINKIAFNENLSKFTTKTPANSLALPLYNQLCCVNGFYKTTGNKFIRGINFVESPLASNNSNLITTGGSFFGHGNVVNISTAPSGSWLFENTANKLHFESFHLFEILSFMPDYSDVDFSVLKNTQVICNVIPTKHETTAQMFDRALLLADRAIQAGCKDFHFLCFNSSFNRNCDYQPVSYAPILFTVESFKQEIDNASQWLDQPQPVLGLNGVDISLAKQAKAALYYRPYLRAGSLTVIYGDKSNVLLSFTTEFYKSIQSNKSFINGWGLSNFTQGIQLVFKNIQEPFIPNVAFVSRDGLLQSPDSDYMMKNLYTFFELLPQGVARMISDFKLPDAQKLPALQTLRSWLDSSKVNLQVLFIEGFSLGEDIDCIAELNAIVRVAKKHAVALYFVVSERDDKLQHAFSPKVRKHLNYDNLIRIRSKAIPNQLQPDFNVKVIETKENIHSSQRQFTCKWVTDKEHKKKVVRQTTPSSELSQKYRQLKNGFFDNEISHMRVQDHLKINQIAHKLGLSRDQVNRRLKILRLSHSRRH